jgi:hypothetical protein
MKETTLDFLHFETVLLPIPSDERVLELGAGLAETS